MKKVISILIISIISITLLSGCTEHRVKTIGVCLPMKSIDRWLFDGDNIRKGLEAKGYNVLLEYAESDKDNQVKQIENIIQNKCDVLLIAAIDCYNLNDILSKVNKAGIKIIAYDRLLMNTEYVDYFCTFDNFEVGVAQAKYIVETLDLDNREDSINIELFSGAIDDSCTPEYYDGQMSILKKYIDIGKIVIKSNQTDIESTYVKDWESEVAYRRMLELLEKYYNDDTELDAIFINKR